MEKERTTQEKMYSDKLKVKGHTCWRNKHCHFHFCVPSGVNFREANRKSQKLFPFVNMAEKNNCVLIHLKVSKLAYNVSSLLSLLDMTSPLVCSIHMFLLFHLNPVALRKAKTP